MTLIEPIRQNPQHTKKYSWQLRLWHWGNALVICGSLITVLINSTLSDRINITKVVQNELNHGGVTVSAKQAGSISHMLSDQVWKIHAYFGYALAGLLLLRLVMEFFQQADQKLIRKIKAAYYHYKATKANRKLHQHELTVKTIYAVFYLLLIIMAVTGLFLAFEDLLAPYKAIRHTVKEIHGFCMYFIIAFIVIHLIGVYLAERKGSAGIVSDMVNGGKA